MKLKLAAIFLLAASLYIAQAAPASAAAPGSNITIKPFLENITIGPNDVSKQFNLTISNDSSFKQIFHLSAINFGSLDETGGLAFQGANINQLANKYGLSNWLDISRNDIELDASQQADVLINIRNDSALSPGAHYAAIVVTASKLISPVGQLTITPKVSSLIFATKTGGETYDMHLVSTDNNGSLWHPPTQVSVRFKSTGNTFIIPRGVVSLTQGSRVISRGIINQQSSIVLPQTIRIFDVPLTKLNPAKSGLFFTNYKLKVDYRYDGFGQYRSYQSSLRVVSPIRLVIVLVFLFIIIAAVWRLVNVFVYRTRK